MTSRAEQVADAGLPDIARRVVELATSIDAPEDQRDGLERLAHVANFAEEVTTNVDGELVNQDAVDTLASALIGARTELEAFASSGDVAQIGAPHGRANEVVDALRRWPMPSPDAQVEQLRNRISGLRSHITQLEGQSSQRFDELGNKLSAVEEQIQQAGAAAANSLNETAAAANATLNERVDALEQRIAEQLPRLDEAIARFQEQFSTSDEERRRRFDEQLDQQKQRMTAAEEDAGNRLEAVVKGLEVQREASSRELQELTEQARKIVGVIANTGMTGGYQLRFRSERFLAELWRVLTVLFLLGAVGVLVWVADHLSDTEGVQAGQLTARIAISVAVGGLATYSGAQAHRHRENAEAAWEQQLALASLPAFLEQLPEEERPGILQTLAFVFFTPRRLQQDAIDDSGEAVSPFIRVLRGFSNRRKAAPPSTEP